MSINKSTYWTEVLFESLWGGNEKLFLEAVAKGGDIRGLDERGNTVMEVAVASGIEIVRLALSADADPNQQNPDGNTCLRAAVLVGEVDLIKLLLSAGAKVDSENPKDGSTSLHLASDKCLPTILAMLVKNASLVAINKFDQIAFSPLIYAVRRQCFEGVRILLEAGADVNSRDSDLLGDVALMFAVENCDLPMVRLLLAAGASPHIKGHMAITPLSKAKRLSRTKGNLILKEIEEHL
jgi:ankyrin repeat protein